MSRTVLAIMAGLLCALAGVKHASSLKADAVRMRRWVQLLSHLALLLRQGTLSIPEALCEVSDASHSPDKLLREMSTAMQHTPLLSPADAFHICPSNWAERNTLSRTFSRIGHGTQQNRCLAVEQSIEEMRLLADSSSTKAEKDAKLWQTLGLTGGTCLTIMLL